MNKLVHWIVTFKNVDARADQLRWWSGEGSIEVPQTIGRANPTDTYLGVEGPNGALISLDAVTHAQDTPSRRATVRMAVVPESIRRLLSVDIGPIEIVIGWIYSGDSGRNWVRLPRDFIGRLSQPIIQGGVYTAELETWAGDIDRGIPLYWSDEIQQQKFPNDIGFSFASKLSQGIESRWPP